MVAPSSPTEAVERGPDPARSKTPKPAAWPRLPTQWGPDGWIAVAASLVIGFSALQLALFSFGRDQSIYVEVAERLLQGHLPYQGTWDFKPPGIFVVYAAALTLFGHGMSAPRLLEVGSLLAGCALMLSLSRSFFVTRRPGWFGAAIWAWTHAQFDFWHTGQPESFAALFTLFGLWAVLRVAESRRSLVLVALTGAAFAVAALLKPPLGGGVLVTAAYLVQQQPAGPERARALIGKALALGLGFAAPLCATAFGFWLLGGWADLYWTLFQFTPNYTRLGWHPSVGTGLYEACLVGFGGFSALIACGSLAAFAAPVWSTREHEGKSLLLGCISMHFVGIVMQAKFFPYHFGATVPLLALLAGLGWAKISRWLERAGAYGALLALPLMGVAADARQAVRDLPGTFMERSQARLKHVASGLSRGSARELERNLDHVADYDLASDRAVAQRVQELTQPGDPIYVWGFEPAIYWLSGREPASRYIYNVPQRCAWSQERTRAELLTELEGSPPKVIVVQSGDVLPGVTGNAQDSATALNSFPELGALLRDHFKRQERIANFDLYVRVTDGS